MADSRLTFILDGRDRLSNLLDRAGDAAQRMRQRLVDASNDSNRALTGMTRDADGRLRDLQGRFVSTADAARRMRSDINAVRDPVIAFSLAADRGRAFTGQLRGAMLSLAPAAIPAAAAAASLALQVGAAGVAVAAYGAALGPQISAVNEATQAEKKYEDAVEKSGRTSEAAVTAHEEYARQIAQMPPASRQAAAALSVLKDEYKGWSDALAADTMPVFTKGLAVATALLPKTTGLVRGASTELNRMVTILAGGMASPGFDRLMGKFEDFATGSLRRANDGIVHLMRTTNTAQIGGSLEKFLAYAKANAPTVADTLKNVGTALLHILTAASDVGVGMLQVVNVMSRLVAAMPTGLITFLLQMAVAMKAVRLAGAGWTALTAGMAAVRVQILAAGTAAAATTGRMAGLRAAFMALSATARTTVVVAGVAALALVLAKLSDVGKEAPPNVDKLTRSLVRFGETGRMSGEGARFFGKSMADIADAVHAVANPSVMQQIDGFMNKWTGGFWNEFDGNFEALKKSFTAADEGLSGLVKSGKADQAAAAFDRISASMRKQGYSAREINQVLPQYKEALAGARFEQELAADAMGLFGRQAADVQAKLDAQKRSVDGLRLSIQALNEVNRAAIDARAGMEAAIDAAAEGAKKHAGALRMVNGELDLNRKGAQEASALLNDLARKTEGSVNAARESGKSWDYAKRQYDRGRAALIKAADSMGLTRSQAERLANQILKTPNKTAYIKGDIKDIDAKIKSGQQKLDSLKQKRKTAVGADKTRLDAEVAAAQRRVNSLIQQKLPKLFALDRTGAGVRAALRQMNQVSDKTVYINAVYSYSSVAMTRAAHGGATGGLWSGGGFKYRGRGYSDGGLVNGPGTETSDDIFAPWVSKNEFVVNARQTRKHLALLRAINEDRLRTAGFAGGGSLAAGASVAGGLAGGMAGSTGQVHAAARVMAAAVEAGVRAELEISSPSKKMKALAKEVGKGLLLGLTGSRDKIKSTSKALAKDIWSTFTGKTDNRLVALLNKNTAKLVKLADQRDKLAAKIAAAEKFASETAATAKGTGALSNLASGDDVSVGSIRSGLLGKIGNITQFTRHIKMLAGKGLNKDMLRQILEMGPEQGAAYANALAGASGRSIKEINALQGKLGTLSTSLGRIGADRLYDAGKKAGKGFLEGLKADRKKIADLMWDIARSMQKSIRKALGIRSPSTVMAEFGRQSTLGLAIGLTRPIGAVDRAMGKVSAAVVGGVTPPSPGLVARGRTTGQPPVMHVHVEVTGAIDPQATAQAVRRMLIKLKRDFGGMDLGVA